jgi:hypothetical protein
MKPLLLLGLLLAFSPAFVCGSNASTVRITVKDIYALEGEKTCGANGQLQFGVTEFKGNLNVNDIKGIGMRLDSSKTYDLVPGKWYDKDYHETNVFRKGEKAIFVSNESVFTERTNYTILLANRNISKEPLMQLNYFTGQNALEDGSGIQFKVSCPGILQLCSPVSLQVLSCNTTSQGFIVIFKGIAYAQINLSTGLEYFLYQFTSEAGPQALPETTNISIIGEDTYMMRIPLGKLKQPVQGITLRVKDCNEKIYRTSVYKSCAFAKRKQANIPLVSPGRKTAQNLTSAVSQQEPQPSNLSLISYGNISSNLSSKNNSPSEQKNQSAVVKTGSWFSRLFGWLMSIF